MTEADQRAAFIQAICKAPKEDAPRLMYADWLDEHGGPERAEFIRVGCELAKPCPLGYSDAWHVDDCCPFCDPLKERERELLSEYWEQWSSAVENYYGRVCFNLAGRRLHRDSERWVGVLFRRGFVAVVTLPADVWIWYADVFCTVCPLEEVWLTTWPHWQWSVHNTDWNTDWSDWSNEPSEVIAESALKKRWPRITFHLPEDRR